MEKDVVKLFEVLKVYLIIFSEKKKSLSAQHHGVTGKKMKNDPETLRKREELVRRIEETRKQLQSVSRMRN